MVRHIVFIKIKENNNKQANLEQLRDMLLDLVSNSRGVVSSDVGFNFSSSDMDLVLDIVFQDQFSLKQYQNSPDLYRLQNYTASILIDQIVCDFNMNNSDSSNSRDSRSNNNYSKTDSQNQSYGGGQSYQNNYSNNSNNSYSSNGYSDNSRDSMKSNMGVSRNSMANTNPLNNVIGSLNKSLMNPKRNTLAMTPNNMNNDDAFALPYERNYQGGSDDTFSLPNYNNNNNGYGNDRNNQRGNSSGGYSNNMNSQQGYNNSGYSSNNNFGNTARLNTPYSDNMSNGYNNTYQGGGGGTQELPWRCPQCGKMNPAYNSMCSCGIRKPPSRYNNRGGNQGNDRGYNQSQSNNSYSQRRPGQSLSLPGPEAPASSGMNSYGSQDNMMGYDSYGSNSYQYEEQPQQRKGFGRQKNTSSMSSGFRSVTNTFTNLKNKGMEALNNAMNNNINNNNDSYYGNGNTMYNNMQGQERRADNSWKCPRCGKIHGGFVGQCGCGQRRPSRTNMSSY